MAERGRRIRFALLRALALVLVLCLRPAAGEELRYTTTERVEKNMLSPPLYFPKIIEIWRRRPLLGRDFVVAPLPFAPTASIAVLPDLLQATRDPAVKSRTALQLSCANNRFAVSVLRRLLAREKKPTVVADALKALGTLLPDGSALSFSELLPYLRHASASVRFEAWKLAPRDLSASQAGLLAGLLQHEVHAHIRHRGYGILAALPHARTAAVDWVALSRRADDPGLRRLAVHAMLGTSVGARARARLAEIVSSDGVIGRFSLADGMAPTTSHDLAMEILAKLLADERPGIRAAAVEAVARLHLQALEAQVIAATQQPNAHLRQTAVRALGAFPNRRSAAALFACLGSGRDAWTHAAARGSLAMVAAQVDVSDALIRLSNAGDRQLRLNVYQLIAMLRPRALVPTVAARLTTETDAELLGGCLEAAASLADRCLAGAVMKHAEHESEQVRRPVAAAIGRMRIEGGYNRLTAYAMTDPAATVRETATLSMGLIGAVQFQATLLKILQSTVAAEDNLITAHQRAIACWSIGRLDALSPALISRLKTQISRPVIPTMMGPAFEGGDVRVSACMALVEHARRTAAGNSVTQAAEAMIDFISRDHRNARSANPPPSSPALRDAGYQANQYYHDDAIVRHEAPLPTYRFDFYRLKGTRR